MKRIIFAVISLAFAFTLAGCATQEAAPVSAASAANDAALAAKLQGKWTGKWSFQGVADGKFELIVASVDGNNLKGEANWYATASGDVKAPLLKAWVRDGVLYGEQANSTSFKVKLAGESKLSGTWSVGAYSGDLTASH
jgi:hypothetical protein